MFEDLPKVCYSMLESTKEIIIIKKGETGYFPITKEQIIKFANIIKAELKEVDFKTPEKVIDIMNKSIGVSKAEREAMNVGSLFGWDVPGANPAMYDENGLPRK